jgi:hypothetical protein
MSPCFVCVCELGPFCARETKHAICCSNKYSDCKKRKDAQNEENCGKS